METKAKYLIIVTSALALSTFQFMQVPISNKPRPSPARAENRKSPTNSGNARFARLTTTVSTSTTTVSTTQVSNEDWMAKMEAKYQKANERISMYCEKHKKDLHEPLSIKNIQYYQKKVR